MALTLSARARLLSQKTNKVQQIILDIDGINLLFATDATFRFWKIGDEGVKIGDPGLKIGGLIQDENSRDYVSLDGTTNNITQQLDVERGGIGSITKFKIALIDKNQELTKVFTPGEQVPDLLGREATVYIGFSGGAHPEDSIILFNGIIDQTNAKAGRWDLTVAHPQTLTRTELFTDATTELDGAINNSVTTVTVADTSNLLEPVDVLRTAVRIDDEIIEYESISGNQLLNCTRGLEGTIAVAHDNEAEVAPINILEGQPIPLALKIMLSTEDGYYVNDLPVTQIVRLNSGTTFPNGIILFDNGLVDAEGITVGDLVTITGATEGANNVSSEPITSIQQSNGVTVLFLGNASLVEENDSGAVMQITSQYDTLPVTNGGVSAGCDMKAKQVDVAQHLQLVALFAASQPDYKFIIQEQINAKDFLVEQLYRPAGYFQAPRKGRYSIGATIPPLVLEELREFNLSTLKNPGALALERSIGRNFFNTILYRFNPDTLEDRFLAGEVIFSQRSVNRIETNQKQLQIDSNGLREGAETRNFIQRQARRYNDRYQFAAEQVKVSPLYEDSFDIEIGDTVLFGDPSVQLPDSSNASRSFVPRLMECQQKGINLKTGRVELTLVDTGFGIDGRFGVISPSSQIDVGSTTTRIFLKRSFGTGAFDFERNKYTTFILEDVLIHNEDYTFSERVTLTGFDSESTNGVLVDPPLSVSPLEDYIFELPYYPDSTDVNELSKMKSIHCFWDPQVEVVSGPDNFSFEVAPADIDKFFIGSFVRVHNDDFSVQSTTNLNDDDAQVSDVDTGTNIVTVDKDLGFSPLAGYKVELIGFPDQGSPYRLL